MATVPPRTERRRARPGSIERPVNGRLYRGTWLLVGLPLLLAAFSVARPTPLPRALLPEFDGKATKDLAADLVTLHANRIPGSLRDAARPPSRSAGAEQSAPVRVDRRRRLRRPRRGLVRGALAAPPRRRRRDQPRLCRRAGPPSARARRGHAAHSLRHPRRDGGD